ncbi:hypothetical protein HDU96_006931, partial [Phlyctochytrium bullatum]
LSGMTHRDRFLPSDDILARNHKERTALDYIVEMDRYKKRKALTKEIAVTLFKRLAALKKEGSIGVYDVKGLIRQLRKWDRNLLAVFQTFEEFSEELEAVLTSK